MPTILHIDYSIIMYRILFCTFSVLPFFVVRTALYSTSVLLILHTLYCFVWAVQEYQDGKYEAVNEYRDRKYEAVHGCYTGQYKAVPN